MAEQKHTDHKHAKSVELDSREALILAAQKVFAEKGFEGATVKDLADEAGVNVSLVSYHFGGKEALYKTCLENFGLDRVESAERILKSPESKEDFRLRLKLFADDFISFHQREPDICKMIHRGIDNMDVISAEVFKNVFYRMFQALQDFVASARKKGFVDADFDAEFVTLLMFGALTHALRVQPIAKLMGKRSILSAEHRAHFIDQWVQSFTFGIFSSAKEVEKNDL